MKKVVQDLTSGGIDWQREKWQSGLGSKFIHQGEKNAAKYADEVIVLSKGLQVYFKVTYGRETHFIPNGVNRPQIREASLITDKFGLKKDSLIFKKSDVEDLREKLQDACDHPEMVMKMKNQAADFICAKYNWDEVVKETMKLYRRK